MAQYLPVDFLTMDEEAAELGFDPGTGGSRSPESRYMGFPVHDDPEAVRLANPATYIDVDDASFLVQVGSVDPLIPYTQSVGFHAQLVATMGPERAELDVFDGAGHGFGPFIGAQNLGRIVAFFDRNLR